MGYILKEDVVRRCEAIRALALKGIDEWSAHTLEYKEQPAQQLYITDKYARLREMRDILMFL